MGGSRELYGIPGVRVIPQPHGLRLHMRKTPGADAPGVFLSLCDEA
jgi:hypothetical protein